MKLFTSDTCTCVSISALPVIQDVKKESKCTLLTAISIVARYIRLKSPYDGLILSYFAQASGRGEATWWLRVRLQRGQEDKLGIYVFC